MIGADPVEVEYLARRQVAGHDPGAQSVDKIAVQLSDVWLGVHKYIVPQMGHRAYKADVLSFCLQSYAYYAIVM